MIDTKELRRLAQAASPGPWIAKNTSGAGLEIYMSHPVYPDKDWPAFRTDSAFCTKGLVSYETWTQFPHEVRDVQQAKNALFIAAANPAVISELIDRLEAAEEAWKISNQTVYDLTEKVIPNIQEKLEAAEKERDALKAKIERMEKQVPVTWQTRTRPAWNDGTWGPWRKCSEEYAEDIKNTPLLHDWLYEARALYTLPGAQPAPSVPTGWKLVPIDPTRNMLDIMDLGSNMLYRYRALLAAAPEAKP
ncbi:MAG: ead/Ea22-like family protein [Afipia sp.]